ncbi:thymidylate synthase [Pseudomonas daroniae]|uniref:Thymidylate synthase n=1 Tax=Phytopseudomonas daroniae TaxID=2487519 RepID=A0A4Q9QL29_9GAMM|nr:MULTISPECIES: YigZ family protein [Pseudomonas]TBU73217.1 thymidylate synthase [Pseudomonas daroniae]TBU79737.1 thymidylate synthase [Pseudomonas daroniae]TBU82544.1 thymidylate synthase [Pseudomonas sp. FRB 228]TBU91743.1 thymidylate synthase [Pseudomonas daroniae]
MPFLLLAPCDYREEIRKSRFLAQARAISTAADAQAFIDQISDPSASHNCWAWKIGQQYRFSDDGEPGGTAGRPILAAIEGQGFDEVAVVVTRWYGGIQLGTGGLARAYGGSANKCLQNAERQEQIPRMPCSCHCGFAELALLKSRLGEFDAVLEQETFDAHGAELQLAVPQMHIEALQRLLADISRGRSRLQLPD